MGKLYTDLLKDIPGIQLPLAKTDYAENIYWVYGIILDEQIPLDGEAVMKKLSDYKIGTRPFFWCMHEQPVWQKMGLFEGVCCPVAEKLARRGFYLPSGLALTEDQVVTVTNTLRSILS
jgi:perosamine synthetase